MTIAAARAYVAVTAATLGQSIPWLMSLDWNELLRWYEQAAAIGKVRVKRHA